MKQLKLDRPLIFFDLETIAAAVFNVEAVFSSRVFSITGGAVPAVCRRGIYCRLTGQGLPRSFVCAGVSPVEVGH